MNAHPRAAGRAEGPVGAMITGIEHNPTCPGPCHHCGWMPRNCTCKNLPARPHPTRCGSCGQWRCTDACLEQRRAEHQAARRAA